MYVDQINGRGGMGPTAWTPDFPTVRKRSMTRRLAYCPLAALVVATAQIGNAAGSWETTGPFRVREGSAGATLPDGHVIVSGGWEDSQRTVGSRAVAVWDPATNVWTAAPPMTEGRGGHAMVALHDGRVLVAGGRNRDLTLGSAETWRLGDPAWKRAGVLPVPRRQSAMLALKDGRALMFGGEAWGGEKGCPAQAWDGKSEAWSTVVEIPQSPCGAGAVRLADGRVLLAGGWDAASARKNAGLWDPAARTWTKTQTMSLPQATPAMVALRDGRAIVMGGYEARGRPGAGAEAFDPGSAGWSLLAPPPIWASQDGAALLDTGDVLIFASAEKAGARWSPRTSRWSRTEAAPFGGGRPLALPNGGLMLLATEAPKVQIWADLPGRAGHWRPCNRPRRLRWDFSLSPLPDGRVLLAGGYVALERKCWRMTPRRFWTPAASGA